MTGPGDRPRAIVVVDDEEPIRTVVNGILTAAGYRVICSGNPAETVDLVRREAPDLILLDIAMPEMDGYQVLRALQANPQTARYPVVFLTAHREFSERVEAFRFGVVDYMTKPFTRELLLRKIDRILRGLDKRPGVVAGAGKAATQLMNDVRRDARTGVLSLAGKQGDSRVVVQAGEVVETTAQVTPERAQRAEFRELDPEREQIVAPPKQPESVSLPGIGSPLPSFEDVPQHLRSVLVVDDNRYFVGFLQDLLHDRGFTVYVSEDGEQALEVALEKRPWLILTDVRMPRVDGFELCRRVRSHSLIRHTRLIFLSGWDDYKERYQGMEAGADEYLSKQTPVRELLLRIHLLLGRLSEVEVRDSNKPAMVGGIDVAGAPGFLQMCHVSRLSGTCRIRSAGRSLEIRFRDGEITGAEGGELKGAEAVFDFIGWTDGQFEFTPGDPGPGTPLGESFVQLLLEGCRRQDERGRSA